MKKSTTTLLCLAFICLGILGFSRMGMAQFNPIDSTFGANGKVTTTLPAADKIIALAEQSDGKIIALGQHHLVRYNANGNIDPTFDNGGIIDSLGYLAASLLVDRNNKIYVGGNSQGSTGYNNGSATLVRYLPNGSVDTTYGQNGKITDGSYAVFSALAIQDNGKIVSGAHKRSIGSFTYLLSSIKRFHSDGRLDSTFLSSPSSNFTSIIKRIKVLANGQLLAVGFGQGGLGAGYYGCYSARFNPIGSIDTSYGSNGIASTQAGSFNPATTLLNEKGSALIDDNGKVFFQTVWYNALTFQILRTFGGHTQQGQTDTIFNAAYTSGANALQAMAAYSEKRLVSAGTSNGDFSLKMLNEFAQIDTSCFLPITIDFGGNDQVGAVLIDHRGDILIAGISDTAFALAKVTQSCLSKDDFVISWKTDNSGISNDSAIFWENNISFLPTMVDVNNDGIFDSTFSGTDFSIQFPSPGTYTIRIKGDLDHLFFGPVAVPSFPPFSSPMDKDKIISIDQWGSKAWRQLTNAFYSCTNLQYNAIDSPNLDSLQSLASMFSGCSSFDANLASWDIGGISDMSFLFGGYSFTAMSTANYDSTLIGWEAQSHQNNVNLGAGGLYYCISQAARDSLIADGWTFMGDTIDPACILTDIREGDKERKGEVMVYPNPASDLLFIKSSKIMDQVQIYSLEGKLKQSFRNPSKQLVLDLSGWDKGVYLISISSGDQLERRKLVVN